MSSDDENGPPPSDPENDGPGGLDPSLHDRLMDQIERFTDALDAAMANPTPEALDHLRKAADQLMRAAGRVLIDVERLLGSRRGG